MSASKLTTQRTIDDVILETVRDGLTQIFGELQVAYLIQAIEDLSTIAFHEIPENPRAFSGALRRLFGETCVTIEDVILDQLSMKLGPKRPRRDGEAFSEYLRDLLEDSYRLHTGNVDSDRPQAYIDVKKGPRRFSVTVTGTIKELASSQQQT